MPKAASTTSREKETYDNGRRQALDRALGQIEWSFGKGSIMRLDDDPDLVVPSISTNSISLDLALGGRGVPRVAGIGWPLADTRDQKSPG